MGYDPLFGEPDMTYSILERGREYRRGICKSSEEPPIEKKLIYQKLQNTSLLLVRSALHRTRDVFTSPAFLPPLNRLTHVGDPCHSGSNIFRRHYQTISRRRIKYIYISKHNECKTIYQPNGRKSGILKPSKAPSYLNY